MTVIAYSEQDGLKTHRGNRREERCSWYQTMQAIAAVSARWAITQRLPCVPLRASWMRASVSEIPLKTQSPPLLHSLQAEPRHWTGFHTSFENRHPSFCCVQEKGHSPWRNSLSLLSKSRAVNIPSLFMIPPCTTCLPTSQTMREPLYQSPHNKGKHHLSSAKRRIGVGI